MIATPAAAAPYGAAAAVLLVAALTKLRSPEDTARALHLAGLPISAAAVRAGSAAEAAVALAALLAPGPIPPVLVAASYAAFSAFVLISLRRRLPLSTCGCLGRSDRNPDGLHLAVDLGAWMAALWWLATSGGSAWLSAPDGRGPGPVLLTVTAVLASLCVVAIAGGPRSPVVLRASWHSGGTTRTGRRRR